MAWFEYWRCRPRRVPVGERAIGESEPDGQTPARAETRLVLPPIPDTGGRLDVLPLGARDTRHAGPRISGWRAMIDRDRELCTKAHRGRHRDRARDDARTAHNERVLDPFVDRFSPDGGISSQQSHRSPDLSDSVLR